MNTIGVTGAGGFLAGWLIARLLADGHRVRATVRHPAQDEVLRRRLGTLAPEACDPAMLSLHPASLEAAAGWREAFEGCRMVHHLASPLPLRLPRDPQALIRPVRDGTLRVLSAARAAGVERVLLTSSCAAIYYGHPQRGPGDPAFSEQDWTDPGHPDANAYARSKTLAERAAWAFVTDHPDAPRLTAINPGGIFGPLPVDAPLPTSLELVRRLLAGGPGCPDLAFSVVDVRDVADLHVRAMAPVAADQRLIAVAGPSVPMIDMARHLRDGLGAAGTRVNTRRLPSWLVRVGAILDPRLRALLPMLGHPRHASSARAITLLGWQPRPAEEALMASARSLLARPPAS